MYPRLPAPEWAFLNASDLVQASNSVSEFHRVWEA